MDALSLLATIFGLVSLAGGAAGYFKASRGDSIIKYQATELQLRDGRISILEKDVSRLTGESVTKDETIKELKTHNGYLQKISQGTPQLTKLTEAIESQTRLLNEFLTSRKTQK